ncbi:DNA helicase [Lactobacillus phage LpeD]|uniref:DNA helicase n=1 Tax=Lactobacillus phage LpeD TaxID=2041210 RepID=A0A291I9N2_9CAUD|nr:DNA helicase [Lactobacillus phage LpeD]ATG86400.1 DNA helicase [Lactobacillus phage LpeD]
MIINVYSDKAHIDFSKETKPFKEYFINRIHEELDPLDPNRFRSMAFRKYHTWDGRVAICDLENANVPTGLLEDLLDLIKIEQEKNAYIHYEINDLRGPRLEPDNMLVSPIIMKGTGVKELSLREDQLGAVNSIYDNQCGVVLSATNSGKTIICITAIKHLLPELSNDDNVLFIAPNSTIMYQVRKNMIGYLGKPIGIWGDNTRDLQQITCATYQTINSALIPPEETIKLTSKKDKLLQRMAKRYAPQILDSVNPLQSLKGLAKNFVPKFKYELDDKAELASLAVSLDSNKAVITYFSNYQKRYLKLIKKKNGKGLEKYQTAKDYLEKVKVTFVDECQHASADSYQKIFKYLGNSRVKIGLTGTLDKDKKVEYIKIKSILGSVICSIDNDYMIKLGVSARPHIKLVNFSKPEDLEDMVEKQMPSNTPPNQATLLKYQLTYQSGIVENDERNKLISTLAGKLAGLDNGAILIVVNSIQHGENIANFLKEQGTEYAFIRGENSSEEREDILSKVTSGDIKVLIGSKVMDEGVDIPNIRYMVYASAGKSFVQTLQRIGRLLRISADKHEVFIFDIVDRNSDFLYNQAKKRVKYYKEQKFEVK